MRGDGAGAPGGAGDREARRLSRRGPHLQYEPALDGLRAAAVVAVLLYHGAAQDQLGGLERWTRGGYLGVSAFFTLSGFLITSLLLAERQAAGRVSFSNFWSRRARRLLPASLALLAAVCVLAPTLATASQLKQLPGDVVSQLAYVLNWHQIATGSNYAAIFTGTASPIQHMWSLAIEEQVYVVVPLAVAGCLLLGRGRRWLLATAFGLATIGSITWGIVLSHGVYSNRVYLGTDTRLAEITIGALAALILVGRHAPARPTRTTRAFDVLALGSCAFVVSLWTSLDLHSDFLFRGGFAIHALAIAIVIGVVTRPFGLLRGALSWGPLVQLGRRSYGVYLIHWPVMLWLTPQRLRLPGGLTFLVQLALTLTIAMASFRLLERPIRTGTVLTSWRGAVAPVVAIAAVALLAAALPAPNPSQIVALDDHPRLVDPTSSSRKDRAEVLGTTSRLRVTPVASASVSASPAPTTTAPIAPTTTAPPPPLKVMVVGDSFAMSIATGLQRWALLSGKAAVLDASITACGFGRGGRNKGVGFNRTWSPECRRRDATLTRDLTTFAPDIVLVAGGMWDVTDRLPPGFIRWTHVGDPAYDAYLAGELQHLSDLLASHGARVVWADSPHWNPIPGMIIFTGKGPYPEAQPPRADRFNQILMGALAGRPNVNILDIAAWMRAQPGGELAPALRVDGVHFTEESTNSVATWLGPQLLAAAGRS